MGQTDGRTDEWTDAECYGANDDEILTHEMTRIPVLTSRSEYSSITPYTIEVQFDQIT